MTHLKIEQNTITENVTSNVIHKLYETAKAIIDAEEANEVEESQVSLKGNLQVSKAYGDEVDWLEAKFPDLHITAGARYIRFADPAVYARLSQYLGDGTGITTSEITNANIFSNNDDPNTNRSYFTNNTNVVSFNELGQLPQVTTIPGQCFEGCTNLTSIDLSNIQSFGGMQCFTGTNLTGVLNLPNLIHIYGRNIFSNCTKITEVNFNPQVFDGFGNNTSTFQNCTGLQRVTGLSNITQIYGETFSGCTSLQSVDLSNVTSINGYAFQNCTSLTSVDLSSCTTIGNKAFNGCTSLTNIGTDLSNTTYISWDNTFANCPITNDIIIQNHDFRNNNPIQAFVDTRIRSLVVRGGTWPDSRAFGGRTNNFRSILGNNPNLLYVDLSESQFTSHSDSGYTFAGSTSLKWVKYPSTLVTFGKSEFGGCTSLEAIVLPAGQVVGSIITESSYGSYAEQHTLWNSAATVPSRLRVYVPDALVNDYKQHYAWSEYTDLIKPMSELPDLQAMISST